MRRAASLRWARRHGFPPAQLQQPEQPRILRAQPGKLADHLSRSLTPNIASAHNDYRKGARHR
jgi:hypothetical protein